MAGDWIKMRADLFTHPKVVRISSALKADRLKTVGGLMSVWCLFDAHSIDGHLEWYSADTVDELIGWSGFSEAMKMVGWLEEGTNSLILPEFSTHNGQSAKRRAQDTDRKRSERVSASEADKKRTREEKRREEVNHTHSEESFEKFWAAYPKKKSKGQAEKAFAKIKPDNDLLQTILNAVEDARLGVDWLKNDGQYIPFPATWLNAKGWEDETQGSSAKPWEM